MRNIYQPLYFISTIFLATFGSLTLAGCGVKQAATTDAAERVTIKALFETPESYFGKKVQVHGEIYTIETLGEGFVGTSAIVRISPADDFSAELLRCEFSRNNPPPPTLEKGQHVTILGKVDAIEGNILLRDCSVLPEMLINGHDPLRL